MAFFAAVQYRTSGSGNGMRNGMHDRLDACERHGVFRGDRQRPSPDHGRRRGWRRTQSRATSDGDRARRNGSLLNPLWYAGAFGLGLVAGRSGDAAGLGFVVETERQVERHLDKHLERLPTEDLASRAIVRQMRDDEAGHALAAERAGGVRPPWPIRLAMRIAARAMTTTAHFL